MYNRENLFEYNECTGRGMCSIFPAVSSFQEVMLVIYRTMSYYILKSETLGEDLSEIKTKVIDGISNLISTTGYSDEQLLSIIISSYSDLIKIRKKYVNLCKAQNLTCKDIKLTLKLTPDMSFSDVIALGHKTITDKNKKMDSEQKCYSELLFVVIKSVSLSLVKLFDYGLSDKEAVDEVLAGLSVLNFSRFSVNKAKKIIKKLAECDLRLWKKREAAQQKSFGNITQTSVSFSTKPGKAILVSGSCLNDLKNVLESVNDIDVYTHGDLLIAHAFEKFNYYKNLKGHFGTSSDNCVLDFATFPGAILLTKHATQNIEFLIRGRLFTTDDIAPKGVLSVSDEDFSQVIKAANDSKGFSKGRNKEPQSVGFNYEDVKEKTTELTQMFNSGQFRHLFILGMSNFSYEQNDYFKNFLKNMPDDCFVISFSYDFDYKNLFHINVVNNFPLQLSVLELLFDKIPVNSEKLTFFLTKCDSNTISMMVNLKQKGVKNIYLANCPPTVINPAVMASFMNLYSILPITDAKSDLENILK